MYPLKVILIGSDDNLMPRVRRELLNKSADREAEYPDVGSTIADLRPAPGDSRLFIVHLKSPLELAQLKRLNGTFIGKPIVALVEGKDPSILIGAMRAGAAQVVPLPLQPDDFQAALDCIPVQFSQTSNQTRVIAVSGVTGGCGSTTIALNLAYEIAYLGQVQ